MLIARLDLSNVVQGMQHARTMKTQIVDCNIKDHVKYQIPKEKMICMFPGQYQNLDHSCTCMICSLSEVNSENGPYLLTRWGSSKEDDHISISRRQFESTCFSQLHYITIITAGEILMVHLNIHAVFLVVMNLYVFESTITH